MDTSFVPIFSLQCRYKENICASPEKVHTLKRQNFDTFQCPQVLACSAKNLLIFEFGLSLAFPTILIGALKGNNDTAGGLYVTPTDATWLGKA